MTRLAVPKSRPGGFGFSGWALLAAGSALSASPSAAQAVRPRPVPDSLLAALRADPAFQYDGSEAGPSLWERVLAWLSETFLAPVFRASATPAGEVVWIGVAVLVVAAVLWALFRGEGSGLFSRRDRSATDAADPLLDVADLGTVDVAARLREAIAGGEWRAAVRLRYLLTLQALDRRGLVAWSRDKTNRTYVAEAARAGGAELGRAFGDVTRAFERVWYGGRAVDAAGWARIAARFDALDARLGAPPAAPRAARRPRPSPVRR